MTELFEILIRDNDLEKFCISSLSRLNSEFDLSNSLIVTIEKELVKEIYFDNVHTEEIKKEIKETLNKSIYFLKKWFITNKDFYISENEPSSIEYQINQLLNAEKLFIFPCFSKNDLLGLVILSEASNYFIEKEIDSIKSYCNLLAIGIELILLRKDFDIIETKLTDAQKFETIGKLSSGLAHDFNNLLTSIFGSVSLLKNKLYNDTIALKLVDNIESCATRARDLTKGILSFGKPTIKRREIIFVENVINELSKVINETFPNYIKVNFDIQNPLYKILGNSTELYQILLNLTVNAKEAIREKGTINIKSENLIIDKSNIFLFPHLNEGNYLKISVSDDGIGISEENLTKIFEPYFSTKIKDTGSGLGLYVTNQLIKAMNGHIEVESILNQGTTFKLYFPAITIKDKESKDKKEKIIMLADDEEMLVDLLADLLESKGFYVLKVTNTKEVLRILNEELKIDLLVIDYNLPEMSGLECATKLRQKGYKIPIILATGETNLDKKELEQSQINFTIHKPYEFEDILEIINKFLPD
jgi:signal transduction histidine kinase